MSTPTLPWPDLSAYNLLLTVTHDKAGNRALILRPKDPGESPEKTSARVHALAPKIEKVCQKIGEQQIRSRALRDQYLVFTGPMVRNQALINRFFGRLFPKSSTVELTLAQAESAESVREAAKARFAPERAGPDTPLDAEKLSDALPTAVDFRLTESGYAIQVAGTDVMTSLLANGVTNEQTKKRIEEHVTAYYDSLNADDIDLIQERQANLDQRLASDSLGYWDKAILGIEKASLNKAEDALKQKASGAPQIEVPHKDYLISLRDDLQLQLDNQGYVMDARLLSRLDQVKGQLESLRADSLRGQGEKDNVQETQPVSDGFDESGNRELGANVEGDMLFVNRDGVRSKLQGDFRINEKILMVPTRAGVAPKIPDRNEGWLTVDEALDRAPGALSFEDMLRAAFNTRATETDAHYWKPMSMSYEGASLRYLTRARERGNLVGELEFVTLSQGDKGYEVRSQSLSSSNELGAGGLPYPAPKVLADRWEGAGFHLPSKGVQNSPESAKSVGEHANIENKQLNNEAEHATDQSKSEHTDASNGIGPDGISADLGGTNGVPEQPAVGDGSTGATDGDLLEQREQSRPTGESSTGPVNQPELQSGEGSTGTAGSVTSPGVDVTGTPEHGAGGRGSLDDGSDSASDGAGLPDSEQTVSGERSTDGYGGTTTGRNGQTDDGDVSVTGGGDLLGTGGVAPNATDEADGERTVSGSSEPDGSTGNADNSGTAAGGTVGEPLSNGTGSASGQAELITATEDSVGSGSEDAGVGAAGEPDSEGLELGESFGDFTGPERFYAPSDEDTRSPTERLKGNIAALLRLKEFEESGGTPEMEDRKVLAGYSGFGGIHADMFSEHAWSAPDWVKAANTQMRELERDNTLTSQEYKSLSSTILNAHYTHSGIIQPMWEALDRFNVPLDRTLEPSAGTLHFKSFMPKELERKVKHMTAVEIDPLTAKLAQAIHPDSTVINKGLEKTKFPDNFFDCAISNIPFGDYGVFDPEHPERKESIHNTFFLKALDKVRPGGVVAFLTSAYVLDAKDESVRREIDDRSHVVGAVRLPSGTFKKSTGTEVVTDILFLQKKGDFEPNYEPLNIIETRKIEAPLGAASAVEFADTVYGPGDMVPGQTINQVYVDHPEFVLGDLAVMTGRYGPELRVLGGGTISEQRDILREAFKALPTNLPANETQTITPEEIAASVLKANGDRVEMSDLPGALHLSGTKILAKTLDSNGDTVDKLWEPPKSAKKRVLASIKAMESLGVLMALESSASTDAENENLEDSRAAASKDADDLIKLSNGKKPIAGASMKVMAEDSRFKLLQGAITVDIDNNWTKADVYSTRTVYPATEVPERAETLTDALAISLAYTAVISESYIAKLMGHMENPPTATDIRQQLVDQNMAFIDPENDSLVERTTYLSGNLRPKIDVVENIIASDPSFQGNLDALKDALPGPLKPSEIKVSADAFWLPQDIMEEFLREGLGVTTTGNSGITPYFDTFKRHWRLEPTSRGATPSMARIAENQEHVARSRWGTKRKSVFDLLDNVFTNTTPKVQDPIPFTNPTRYQTNTQETLKAQGKHDEIIDAFSRWLFKSPARAQRLADIYNERFNTWVLHEPDGSHMVYPGMAETFVPRKHQSDFIWRAVSGRNAMTAHVVGAGKTMQLIGSAIRGKQMGRWKKPLVVVPNHMLEQFTNDGHEIYPGAKILAMSASDARADNRAAFAARCAMGDWDMVVCTHSVFEKVTVPQEFEVQIIEKELSKLRAALSDDDDKTRKPKEIEKALKSMEERMERTMEQMRLGNENILNMREIGIDFIGVDEAHYFKNLMVDTSQQIPGVSNASSKRAMNMLIKSQYLNEIHGGPYGVMMATGTPISNSVTECYTFMRMLRPDLLESMEIRNFNDWMGLFGEIKHGMELKPEGGGYQMKSRLSRFKNIPELVKTVRTFIDFKTREDLDLPTPKVITEQIAAPQSPMMKLFMQYIEARAKTVRAGDDGGNSAAEKIAAEIRHALNKANDKTVLSKDTGEIDPDIDLKAAKDILLTIATDGRKASLDMRLIHPGFEDFEDSKVNMCVRKCYELYQKFDEDKAAQMIFCDFSSPTGKGIFNVYDDIKAKLIKAGVPENEVAFIHDAKTDSDKEALFAKVRSGEVRFILGSTQKMGVGTNVQERLIALHQLDPPWKPADIEQRLGRMDRQGNMFKETYSFIWNQQDSFDLFMWETLNRKLKMIQQAMRKPEDCAREINEDTEVGYEDILAITTGNPAIKDFLEARVELERLKRMSDSHTDQQADLAGQVFGADKKVHRIEEYLEMKRDEQKLVNSKLPLHIEFDGPAPELRDGPMCTAGGLDGLSEAIKNASERVPSYRTVVVGKFGGLNIKMSRLATEPMLLLERLDGREEKVHLYTSQQEMFAQKVEAASSGKEDQPKKSEDESRSAAKALVRMVHKIASDNGIQATTEALDTAKTNLENLKEDMGRPFEYEEQYEATRIRYDALALELGDAIDSDKEMDPAPLVELCETINNQTGDYSDLPLWARNMATATPAKTQADIQEHLEAIDNEMGMGGDDDDFDHARINIG